MSPLLNTSLLSESEWLERRNSMVLADDELDVRVDELNQAEIEAYIGRRHIGLNRIETLKSCATAAAFVGEAREYFDRMHHLDTSSVCDALIGYLALRAIERSALNYAETRFYELQRHARLLRFEAETH